jgi:lycopene cyclase domain-containing protein
LNTYLFVNIAIIGIPFLLSFDAKVHFYKKWKYVIPAIAIPGFIFIVWDIWFTKIGVWSFNLNHLTGIKLFGLPIEEHLFFITVPYASLFTYEVLKCYWPELNPKYIAKSFFGLVVTGLTIVAAINISNLYTSVTFFATSLAIIVIVFILNVKFSGRFLLAFFLIIFPFLFFNGILTGSGLEEPVVIYNNAENLRLRILTIPIEDTFYGMLLILLNVFFFELFRKEI